MQSNAENGAYFLLAGFGLLSVVVASQLLRGTRGLSGRVRLQAMFAIIRAALLRWWRKRWTRVVRAAIVGFVVGFAATALIMTAVVCILVALTPPPRDEFDGFGVAMFAWMLIHLSSLASLLVGCIAAYVKAVLAFDPPKVVPLDNSPLPIKSPRLRHE